MNGDNKSFGQITYEKYTEFQLRIPRMEIRPLTWEELGKCHGDLCGEWEQIAQAVAKAALLRQDGWVDVETNSPPFLTDWKLPKPYVLAIDDKKRMSVGYARRYDSGHIQWTFAKAIGDPTHWIPLPEPPSNKINPAVSKEEACGT